MRELKGMRQVLTNINREVERIKGASTKGLILAAIEIHRDTENTSPITPVDTGNLRSSWYVVTGRSVPQGSTANFRGKKAGEASAAHTRELAFARGLATGKPIVVFGFSANYAFWVHEDYEKRYKRPRSGAGFFVSSIKNKQNEIINIIANESGKRGY